MKEKRIMGIQNLLDMTKEVYKNRKTILETIENSVKDDMYGDIWVDLPQDITVDIKNENGEMYYEIKMSEYNHHENTGMEILLVAEMGIWNSKSFTEFDSKILSFTAEYV